MTNHFGLLNKNDFGPWIVIIFTVSVFSFVVSGFIVGFVEHPVFLNPWNACPPSCPPESDYAVPLADVMYLAVPMTLMILLAFYWIKKVKGLEFTRA